MLAQRWTVAEPEPRTVPLAVSAELEAAVITLVEDGFYHSAEDLLESALHILTWAENHPDGQRELQRYFASLSRRDGNVIEVSARVWRRLSPDHGQEH